MRRVLVIWAVLAVFAGLLATGSLIQDSPSYASAGVPPEVATVPFHGELLAVPHDAWIGKEIIFKGTAHDPDGDATMVAYKWDFGDGYSTGWISGVSPYAIEAMHAYTGTMADGTPYGPGRYFTAWLYVEDDTGLIGQDSYFVAIRDVSDPDAMLKVEVNVAKDNGLWWLHKQQIRGTYPDGAGYGYWDNGSYDVAATGAAVEAFELQGHLAKGDPYDISEDPYVETVQRGLNYLFNHMVSRAIGQHATYCPFGNPDINGNGIGLACFSGELSREMYESGIVLMTMGSSKAPDRVATTGPVAGRTYLEITQDMVDFMAWGQSDPYTGNYEGGWRYSANYGASDNSVSQWPVIGMEAAQRNLGEFGLSVPDFVRPELLKWLNWSQCGNGGFGYTSPCEWVNTAKTGAGAAMLSWAGVATDDPRYQNALSFLDAHWFDSASTYTNFGDYYTMYAIMKGMVILHPGVEFIGSHDWYAEYARYIVDEQNAYGGEYVVDHSWLGGSNVENRLATAWAMLILTPTVVLPGPVADAGPDVDRHPPIVAVEFDGSASYHRDPTKEIAQYCWDFGDGSPEECSPTPTAEHAYPAVYNPDGTINWDETTKDYVATLRVIDNNVPPLEAEDTCVVHIAGPPWKPVADADGPYEGGKRELICLDGSGSYDPESQMFDPTHPWYEEIATYEWDLDNDGLFDDSTEMNPCWSWESKGAYGVCLKVTDSVPSGPGGTIGDLDVDIDCAVVTIYNRDPIADADGPYALRADMTVELDGSGSWDPDGDPLSYRWDCESDGTWDTGWSPSPLATCTYPERVEYTVTLQVQDGDEGYGQDQASVMPVIEIEIDIKPGSFPNSINLKSKGVIPVAILTTEDFDATTVDADTVRFGPNEAEKVHKRAHVQDADGDGDLDMVLHFKTQDTGIAPGDTEACLTGQTYDGLPIVGCDSVRIVPDRDCDGCSDGAELLENAALGGQRDPDNPWDFYDVPVPTAFNGGTMDDRDQAVSMVNDVLAVLKYAGASDGGACNAGPDGTSGNADDRCYNQDNNTDGQDDGLLYDRSVGASWSDAPDGAISILEDVLLVLAQSGHSCQAEP